ncbi:MAG: hypothetical protein OHK006_11450 [Thermodesulfovibrionales bacterium]
MGIAEANKYIKDLRKRQADPFLWPDYLTGLPEKPAIIRVLEEAYPKLGEYSVVFVRIANIQPYLLKYGPDNHANIIQWAAAVLKTSARKCRNSFVGTLNTHDFVVVCRTKNMQKFFCEANELFRKKAETFYSQSDVRKGTVLYFNQDDGQAIRIGLMKLIGVVADSKLKIKRQDLIRCMSNVCDLLEGTEEDFVVMNNRMICG